MKNVRVVLAIVLIGMMGLGWISQLSSIGDSEEVFVKYVVEGEAYAERKLYQKAISSYEKALKAHKDADATRTLINFYRYAYEDDLISDKAYIKAYTSACNDYPDNISYWEEAISFCVQIMDYDSAYRFLKDANGAGAESEKLSELSDIILYSFTEKGQLFDKVCVGPNGYAAVFNGSRWGLLNTKLDWFAECSYVYLSPLGESAKQNNYHMLYVTQKDKRVIDGDGIVQAIVDVDLTEARAISNGLLPIKNADGWTYYDYNSEKLAEKVYDDAYSFASGKALVAEKGSWYLIDTAFNQIGSEKFSDAKVFTNGEYIYNNIMVAARSGKYSMYNGDGAQIVSFTAEDMDVYCGGWVAYKAENGKWGFVNTQGEITIAPTYEEAKSFSNGVAAVKLDGKWGFINTAGNIVIDPVYLEAGYFSAGGTCVVSLTTNEYHMIKFRFRG